MCDMVLNEYFTSDGDKLLLVCGDNSFCVVSLSEADGEVVIFRAPTRIKCLNFIKAYLETCLASAF